MKTTNRLRITVKQDGEKYLWQVFDELAEKVVSFGRSSSYDAAEQCAKNWIVFDGNTGDNGTKAMKDHDEIVQAEKVCIAWSPLELRFAKNRFSGDARKKNYHTHITKYVNERKMEVAEENYHALMGTE